MRKGSPGCPSTGSEDVPKSQGRPAGPVTPAMVGKVKAGECRGHSLHEPQSEFKGRSNLARLCLGERGLGCGSMAECLSGLHRTLVQYSAPENKAKRGAQSVTGDNAEQLLHRGSKCRCCNQMSRKWVRHSCVAKPRGDSHCLQGLFPGPQHYCLEGMQAGVDAAGC